jgi:hypothetical protein
MEQIDALGWDLPNYFPRSLYHCDDTQTFDRPSVYFWRSLRAVPDRKCREPLALYASPVVPFVEDSIKDDRPSYVQLPNLLKEHVVQELGAGPGHDLAMSATFEDRPREGRVHRGV